MRLPYMITDNRLTRRKRFHHIYGADNQHVWSGQKIGDAIEWLIEHEIMTFELHPANTDLVMEISISNLRKEPS